MSVALVAVLVAAALIYVLAALARGPRGDDPDASTKIEEANATKHAALAALVDLEIEREMGKLSEDDFRTLAADYEAEAVIALRRLDAADASRAETDPLEAEIASIRRRLECPSCGALRAPGEKCVRCGD